MMWCEIEHLFTFQYVSINTMIQRSYLIICHTFTFQYVSINTNAKLKFSRVQLPLHSNMFLLIHCTAERI